MAFRPVCVVIALAAGGVFGTAPVLAQQQAQPAAALYDVLQIDDMIAVLRDEGIADAAELAADFGPAGGSPGWDASVARIYDPAQMQALVKAGLDRAMAGKPDVTARAIDFFGSAPGKRALQLETDARRALMDKDTEAAATLRWQDMVARGDPRVALIRRFAEVNDLIESNVAGAMNSSLAFYQGLAGTGGPFADMTEADILDLARGKEGETRASTEEWLFPFLALAYQPLTDAELRAYTDYSATPAGQQLNAAMFAAFNGLFNSVSHDLGRAVGLEMAGQDI
ncbi:hypothetical protein [Fuscibacter oryzae]|uniref:DUF2059 domain-containing protein n=1 Tax=Fuscibacter oryzae TaxID=2803939 RepID=A0A8J7MNM6_9RHOB|nr:hypothetical protein [Fuscibacter oryzae]MBL4927131.1 hypothetical protein [Fuscibacter oryzae]